MTGDSLLKRLHAEPDDVREQRRLARELAHAFHLGQPELLREVLAGLAAVRTDDARARGYLGALAHVTAAFEAELRPRAARREAARALKVSWRKILGACPDGSTPSDIAAATGLAVETVSRGLKELRDGGFVEAYEREGDDARKRPHRLTRAGRELAAGLVPQLPQSVDAVIAAATAFHARLNRELEVVPRRLLEPVGRELEGSGLDARALVDALGRAAVEAGTARWAGAALRAESGEAVERVREQLDASVEREATPSFLVALARTAPPAKLQLVVRAARSTQDAWRVFLRSKGNPFADCQVIEHGHVLLEAVEPPTAPFTVLYDVRSLKEDDAARASTRSLQERARSVHVVEELLAPEVRA